MKIIHPTAVIGNNVEIGDDVEVGPYTVIEGEIKIGRGTKIGPQAYITGYTEIGENNEIHKGAVIGHLPQDKAFEDKKSYLKVGDRNVFREFCTIHRGAKPDSATLIGSDNYLMANAHVAHNCELGSNIIICNAVLLGGWVVIEDRVFIGGMGGIHQFVRVGRNAMIGGIARVIKDVPPYLLCEGNSAIRGVNSVGLKRAGYTPEQRLQIKNIFKDLYLRGMNVSQFCEKTQKGEKSEFMEEYIEFIKKSKRGLCRYQASSKEKRVNNEKEN